MCTIFDLGDTEGHAFQSRTIGAELDDLQGGLDTVGEHELGILVGVQLNNALRFINDIARAEQFRYHIGTRRELAQVDLTVFIGSELFGTVVTRNGFNLKQDIGDDFRGIGTVHLHQSQAGLDVVEEHQLLDAVTGFQLYFLGGGVEDMPITACIHFHGSIGAGLHVGQKDFTELIGAEGTQRNTVTPDLKGDVGHSDHILAVVLDDAKARQLLVDQMECSGFTGNDGRGVDGIIQQPSRRSCSFFDSIRAGLDLTEDGNTCGVSLSGIALTAFNVGNRDQCSGQVHAGVGGFLDAEIAVGLVFKHNFGHLTVDHLHILGRFFAEQVKVRRDPLIYGVVSGQGQRDADLTGGIGGKGTNSGTVRTNDLEHGAAQRDGCAGFVLDDLEAGIHFHFGLITIVTVGGQVHFPCGVGVHHVILDIAVFIHLNHRGIEDGVLVNIQIKGQLHAAGLSGHAVRRVEDLELCRIAFTGGAGGQGGDVIVIHVHDAGAGRNAGRVRESDIDFVIAHPGLRCNRKDLLLILAAVDGHFIGNITVRSTADIGRQIFGPCRATAVDVLGCGEDLLRTLQFKAGQVGVDLQVVDVPMGQEIAPQGHFGGIVGVVLILKAQLAQAAIGIAVGDDTGDLGICRLFIGQILDAFAHPYGLGNALIIGVHAVGRDFFDRSGWSNTVIVGIDLLTDTSVDRQIRHCYAAIENIDLAQCFLFRRCCESGGREHTKKHDDG